MGDLLLTRWGQILRQHRKAAGLTQEELAERLNPPVNQSTIARWETGEREPRRQYKAQLADQLDTHVAVLWPHPREAVAS